MAQTPELKLLTVCENAFVAENTKSLNLISIFDILQVENFPFFMPKFTIVSKFKAGPGSYSHEIIIKKKDGEAPIAVLPQTIIIATPSIYGQSIGTFFNFKFDTDGEYLIEIKINGIVQDLNTSIYVKVIKK